MQLPDDQGCWGVMWMWGARRAYLYLWDVRSLFGSSNWLSYSLQSLVFLLAISSQLHVFHSLLAQYVLALLVSSICDQQMESLLCCLCVLLLELVLRVCLQPGKSPAKPQSPTTQEY